MVTRLISMSLQEFAKLITDTEACERTYLLCRTMVYGHRAQMIFPSPWAQLSKYHTYVGYCCTWRLVSRSLVVLTGMFGWHGH